MKIIIVGQGKVGRSIAIALAKEKHDIIVVEQNAKVLSKMRDTLDVMTLQGNGTSADTLVEAGVESADLCIAVTSSDEANLLCCLIAKKLGATNTIARVRNPQYAKDLYLYRNELGLSMHINPELEAAREISKILRFPSAIHMESFCAGKVDIVEGKVEERSPLVGCALKDLRKRFRSNILVCAVDRNGEVTIPAGDFVLQANDRIHIIGKLADVEHFIENVGTLPRPVQKVMIVGGGKISYYLGMDLSKTKMQVKIIEMNEERCKELALALPKVMVLEGDGTDSDILDEEGFKEMDAFVALTGIDEENIILALNAIQANVKKVITKVHHIRENSTLYTLGIDTYISPKDVTANKIVSYVRAMQNSFGSNVEAMSKIVSGKVEALEFVVKRNMPFINIPLMDLKFKKNLLIGCIVRNGEIIYPKGNDVILTDDHIIVVTTQEGLQDVSDIFAK